MTDSAPAQAGADDLRAFPAATVGQTRHVIRLPAQSDRLRSLIASAPDRDGRAAEACGALGVSEATLRRHLAAEGTSFSAVLADVRMGVALTLLQGSGLAVNRVALEVGYACASRFARRFRKRFGLAPSDLRRV